MAKRYKARRVKSEPHDRAYHDRAYVNSVNTADKVMNFTDEINLGTEQESLQSFLKSVHFKRKLLGGVSEADVWKKISELNSLYETALAAERTRYNALLKERTGNIKFLVRNERQDDE